MAFVLTPRFAPAYQAAPCNPFGYHGPVSQPQYTYRIARPRPQRPQYSSLDHFFNQVDDLLSEVDQEAQRQAHLEAQRKAYHQRQQRKRALRAKFAVNQTEQGWQVDGDVQGFDQENITLEITDENTLKIAGNTEWQAAKKAETETTPAVEQQPAAEASQEKTDGVTLDEPEFETVTEADIASVCTTTQDSDTESHKSYQATVEDDFEDLGAETSSLVSSHSRPSSPAEVKEPKGNEKAVEVHTTTNATVAQQPPVNANTQQEQRKPQQEDRARGSFERTFQFPERIDAANVSASFKDGVLKITVPKAQTQQARRIAIL